MPHSSSTSPKRVAVIATVYRYLAHAQHLTDRLLHGYPWQGRWHQPNVEVVSLYVDQFPEGDQSRDRAREFGFTIYPTIAEALRCAGDRLAVDGVLLFIEHGDYPSNEKGQRLYPRHEFFKECVRVFEEDGRSVPVFNDKHLSYSFEKAREMVDDSRRLGFPLLAGSSVPEACRFPELELPLGCEVEEALLAGFGSFDGMDYHALEGLQCMVERRSGGETGVQAVQLLEGDAVWAAGDGGLWSQDLLAAALSRSDSICGLTDQDGRTQDLVGTGRLRALVESAAAYLIDYTDGLRATLLLLSGAVKDLCFAAKLKGTPEPVSTQFLLAPLPNVTHFTGQIARIEELIENGRSPIPAERTLLVSGVLEACLASRVQGHVRLDTPDLDVRYQAPVEPRPVAEELQQWPSGNPAR